MLLLTAARHLGRDVVQGTRRGPTATFLRGRENYFFSRSCFFVWFLRANLREAHTSFPYERLCFQIEITILEFRRKRMFMVVIDTVFSKSSVTKRFFKWRDGIELCVSNGLVTISKWADYVDDNILFLLNCCLQPARCGTSSQGSCRYCNFHKVCIINCCLKATYGWESTVYVFSESRLFAQLFQYKLGHMNKTFR